MSEKIGKIGKITKVTVGDDGVEVEGRITSFGGFIPPLYDYWSLSPIPLPSKRTKRKGRWKWKSELLRERIALFIAPWLEQDPYDD